MFKTGDILCSTVDCEEGLEKIKAWIKQKGLTPDDVKLGPSDGCLLVVAKRMITNLNDKETPNEENKTI